MMQPMLFSWLYFTLVSLQSPVRGFSPGIPQVSDLVGTCSFCPFCRSKVFPQQEYDVMFSPHYTTQHCVQPADCLNCISCAEGTTQDPTFLFIHTAQAVANPQLLPLQSTSVTIIMTWLKVRLRLLDLCPVLIDV